MTKNFTYAPSVLKRTPYERGNILIIEDDTDVADILVLSLVHEGYAVRKVTSRDDAIIAMRTNIYRFIIMDYAMPGLSAEKFLEFARSHTPISQIILITASDRVGNIAAELGIKNWLGKPLEIDRLLEILGAPPSTHANVSAGA